MISIGFPLSLIFERLACLFYPCTLLWYVNLNRQVQIWRYKCNCCSFFFISFDSVSCVGWCECTGADIDISQFLVPFFDNVCSLGDFIGKVKYLIAFNLREGVLFCPHTSTGRKFQNLIKFILTKKISPCDSFVFTSWWAWWINRVEIPRFFFVRI